MPETFLNSKKSWLIVLDRYKDNLVGAKLLILLLAHYNLGLIGIKISSYFGSPITLFPASVLPYGFLICSNSNKKSKFI